MKKLISAAASLAMAASMVSSAVPFATGAADATKGFELRTFLDVNGKEVSSTISADAISAGEVTIPVGLFLVEDTNDSQTLSAQFTVKSSDGDASNSYVKFVKHKASSDYFASAQSFTLAGSSGSTKTLVGFAGKIVNDDEDGDYFSATVKGQEFAEENSKSAGTDNAFGSIAYTGPTSGTYSWSGDKSDSYPVCVWDVVFAKGTPAGTYTIDFCKYAPDADYPDNRACMIETAAGKMTDSNSKLTLKSLDITIEGSGSGTTAPATTTAPADTTTAPATTTQGGGSSTSDEVDEKFIIKPKDATVEAGGTVNVDIICENGSNRKAAQFVAQVIDANLPIKGATSTMSTVRCSAISTKPEYNEINGTWYCDTLDSGEPQEIDTSKAVAKFAITVPADATPGTYEWKLDRFHVVEDGYNGVEFDANLQTGKLEVTGGGSTTASEEGTTTTQPTTTATAADTTATAADTTATAADTTASTPAGVVYGDVNCDGKVNIADVVVLNKYNNDASSYAITAQGKVNADCCDAGDGINANDSDAIIKSIVHLVDISKGTVKAADLK